MDRQILPWIKDDIAIEIIGKMIAEQNKSLNMIVDAYEQIGLQEDSVDVQKNRDYQYHAQRIQELHTEIQQIYQGENTAAILERVDTEYAPYIRGRMKSTYVFA